jgi:predicted HicB family RNase H-like nuclease
VQYSENLTNAIVLLLISSDDIIDKSINRTMMTYKGYSAIIEVDTEAEILFGRVIDINDVITFKAKTIEEARQEFHNSVDDYLAYCEDLGE